MKSVDITKWDPLFIWSIAPDRPFVKIFSLQCYHADFHFSSEGFLFLQSLKKHNLPAVMAERWELQANAKYSHSTEGATYLLYRIPSLSHIFSHIQHVDQSEKRLKDKHNEIYCLIVIDKLQKKKVFKSYFVLFIFFFVSTHMHLS